MSGMLIMTFITLVFGFLVWGGFLFLLSGRKPGYLVLILMGIPLSALVNILVKGPLAVWVGDQSGYGIAFAIGVPLWLLLFYAFLAPVTEEAIKVTPLLLPPLRRLIDSKIAALWAGFALGIGFGLGEVLYLGYSYSQVPDYATIPWYAFTGFLIERMLAVFAHGVLTSIFVAGMSHGVKWGLIAYLVSVGLHFILNLGAALLPMGLIDVATVWMLLIATVMVFAVIFEVLRRYLGRKPAALPNTELFPPAGGVGGE